MGIPVFSQLSPIQLKEHSLPHGTQSAALVRSFYIKLLLTLVFSCVSHSSQLPPLILGSPPSKLQASLCLLIYLKYSMHLLETLALEPPSETRSISKPNISSLSVQSHSPTGPRLLYFFDNAQCPLGPGIFCPPLQTCNK